MEGVARGRIRFTGEDGYTRVAVDRAKAVVETWPKMRCRFLEPEQERARKWTMTFEAFREVAPNVSFTMGRYPRHLRPRAKQIEFRAHTVFTRGPLRIFRSIQLAADASHFLLLGPKAAPENFMVAPPPPFSGTATFQRTPESVYAWEGDLSIQFPGAAPVPLAGPAFNTHYCALRGCISQVSH
ncbi:MAG TPA: hypothetical protein VD741_02010 [Solirubrobacterales bacterium]|nr:hypothetical protein [Solirubrobacterales bacterium]